MAAGDCTCGPETPPWYVVLKINSATKDSMSWVGNWAVRRRKLRYGQNTWRIFDFWQLGFLSNLHWVWLCHVLYILSLVTGNSSAYCKSERGGETAAFWWADLRRVFSTTFNGRRTLVVQGFNVCSHLPNDRCVWRYSLIVFHWHSDIFDSW